MEKGVRGQETEDLFAEDLQLPPHDELIPDIEITEAEYRETLWLLT